MHIYLTFFINLLDSINTQESPTGKRADKRLAMSRLSHHDNQSLYGSETHEYVECCYGDTPPHDCIEFKGQNPAQWLYLSLLPRHKKNMAVTRTHSVSNSSYILLLIIFSHQQGFILHFPCMLSASVHSTRLHCNNAIVILTIPFVI